MDLIAAGGSLLIILFAIYILAIMTDEYFIPSLDHISGLLNIPSNVAGASLMAMGSSAPELAIALTALFEGSGEHSDVGIGTIVGSAVFNILVITGASALARPAKITLSVVIRDCLVYVLSIALLLYTFYDGQIHPLEAFSFLVVYLTYLIILYKWNSWFPEDVLANVKEAEESEQLLSEQPTDKGQRSIMVLMKDGTTKVLGIFAGSVEQAYLRVFFVSIAIIIMLSWILVKSVIVFGNATSIPPVIIALTLLAAGTSAPDMISSVVVARQGRGDMAVANAVGSNIFDILVGLGFPWLLAMGIGMMTGAPAFVEVGTADLLSSTLVLLGTVFVLFLFLYTERTLSRIEGGILIFLYVLYVLWIWLGG
ncbi:MAG: calcium/sodium antiporter [Candidatus Electrothrix sp. GW3-4]|uniref:calcium/sodium antiporter n=1 Tax=Candidatus Electrothrix sp. GW3-4 TaxID=3126740 RepID=UPI0030CCAA56